MSKLLPFLAAVALGAPLVAEPPYASVPRVTTDKLEHLELQQHPHIVIIDVRTPMEYRMGHIAGALNWSIALQPTGYVKLKLPRNEWIVTYCT